MSYEEFIQTINNAQPPAGISPLLIALWHESKGDWESAHNIAQDIHDKNGSWIHAYLHRKEGDLSNARYWYSMAGRKEPGVSLEREWEEIVRELIR